MDDPRVLEEEINRARRHGRQFGVLLLRLNPAGYSEEAATLLSKWVRNYDRIVLAGDFELLFTDTGPEQLQVIGQRILRQIGGHGFDGGRTHLSASAGGAVFPIDGLSPGELLERAREAVGQAGPNCYMRCPWGERDDPPESVLTANHSGRNVLEMISRLFMAGGDIETLLRRSLNLMSKAVEADGGLIFLLRDGARLRAVLNMPDRPLQLDADDYSSNVLRRAITQANAILVEDVAKDAWASGLESVQDLGATSILVVPIMADRKVLGAVWLDSRRKEKRFSPEDRALLQTFAGLIAGPIEQGAELHRRTEEMAKLEDVVRNGLAELERRYQFGSIIGSSKPMRAIFEMIERVAPSPYPVILVGETGTGKELVAKAIHFNSPRKDKPFLPVNCGAVAETLLESHLFGHVKGAFTGAEQARPGLFEAASGGTLFLDEVEEMSDGMQKKILRVLEESQVWRVGSNEPIKADVRVVAATNQEIDDLVDDGRFRKDLYYRLNTILLRLPPLRERAEDIPLLVEHFLDEITLETRSPRLKVTGETMGYLVRYPWPGNVRELRNELRKLAVLSRGEVGPENLPAHIRETTGSIGRDLSLRDRLGEMDQKLILEALERHDWNISRAAEDLGLSRNTLKTRMRKHGIRKSDR